MFFDCLVCNLCVYCCLFTAVMYMGCRLRVLPVPVMRVWYIVCLIVSILVMASFTWIFDHFQLIGVPKRITKQLCAYVCWWTFWSTYGFCPHIQIKIDESEVKWAEVPKHSAMAINHTSFFDAFFFTGTGPWCYLRNCKVMMKDSLKRLPIFGAIFDRVGHFPVYFKSEADGQFGVDKERQAPIMEEVKTHLAEGGRLCLFPEGAVNKNARTLQPFRHGTFAMVLEQKLPLYYMVMLGNDVTWPARAAVGGLPANIQASIHYYPIDFSNPDLTAKDLAEGCQKAMQEKLDALYAIKDKKKQ